jgi:hypothetical protein
MKKTLAILLIISIFACSEQKDTTNDANIVGSYGAEITTEGAVSTSAMMNKLGNQDSLFVKISSEIVTTCAMKGCWMNLVLADGEEMRVTFKDYAFFVPKEGMGGNQAIIEGYVKRVVTDAATLQHYAEDAGKTEQEIASITEDKEGLTFEALGVIIFESTED